MRFSILNGHASVTSFAMVVVYTQPLAQATNATAMAMVSLPTRCIVIKLALSAKVSRKPRTTTAATRRDGLDFATLDATHFLRSMSIDFVVLLFVVTPTTRVETAAALGLDPAFAAIVGAAGGSAGTGEGGVGAGSVWKGGCGWAEEETTTFGV